MSHLADCPPKLMIASGLNFALYRFDLVNCRMPVRLDVSCRMRIVKGCHVGFLEDKAEPQYEEYPCPEFDIDQLVLDKKRYSLHH